MEVDAILLRLLRQQIKEPNPMVQALLEIERKNNLELDLLIKKLESGLDENQIYQEPTSEVVSRRCNL